MNIFNRIKIGKTIMLLFTCTIFIVLIALFFTVNHFVTEQERIENEKEMISLASQFGNYVDAELEIGMDAVRTLSHAFQQIDKVTINQRRDYLFSAIKTALENNPTFFGMSTCWEANALDGLDSKYMNKENCDNSGRFIPYFFKDEGRIKTEALKDYEVEGVGDWYLLPKKTMKEVIVNPYKYTAGNKDYLMTTVSAPIIINNKFCGVVTVDMLLTDIQHKIDSFKYSKTGFTCILSNNGTIVTSVNSTHLGKTIQDIAPEISKNHNIIDKIKRADSFNFEAPSFVNDELAEYSFVPIRIGRSELYWNIGVVISTKEIYENVNKLRIVIFFIALFAIVVMLIISFLIARLISKYIKIVVQNTQTIINDAINGNLKSRSSLDGIHVQFQPIINGINQTLDAITEPLAESASYIEKIAKGKIPEKITTEYKGDFNELKNNINNSIDAINLLISDANYLTKNAIAGEFEARADIEKHSGDYKKIITGVNKSLDIVVDKVFWYEQMLDSIPFPISVTDMNMNWTFFNRQAEIITGKTRKEMIGKQCSNWGADICKTEKCGIALMRKGTLTSHFLQPGLDKNFQVDTSYLIDKNGINIGHIEVVQDVTKMRKIDEFTKLEVKRISSNLEKLSIGDLEIDTNIQNPTEYIKDEYENFKLINNNMKILVDALKSITQKVREISVGNLNLKFEKRSENDLLLASLANLWQSEVQIMEKAKQIAEGDLTVQVRKRSENDELMIALEGMVSRISTIVGTILVSAESIAEAASQMNISSQQMSQGTSEQAAAAEEVSSSIEEMAANIHQNTENALHTESLAIKSTNDVNEANDALKLTVKAMEEIAEKIEIIYDIAEKTDILAINAAIEAARAGEQGKGFAVVAAEVRKLAENSQIAAKEIGEVSKRNVQISKTSGDLLSKVVPDIEKTTQLVQEIAAGSSEMNNGANQINSAVNQLNQVVQQNAASAEELSANAEVLSQQADTLREQMSFFKMNITSKSKFDKKYQRQTYKNQISTSNFQHSKPVVNLENDEIDKEFGYYESNL